MSSIWIILLDTSGSMGEGFRSNNATNQDPLAESGAWATKLDAAKELLLRQVDSLHAQDLAVIRFYGNFEKIFHGPKDELLRSKHLIQDLSAKGGTRIDLALDSVSSDIDFEKYRSLSVLVLSDGLSDSDTAKRAAERLIDKFPYARIDTILIDESENGRSVADAISINGTVKTVTSTIQLRKAIRGARVSSLQSELSNMAIHRFMAQKELSSFEYSAPPTLITVTSDHSLTAVTLRNDLSPTIGGIEAIGKAVCIATRSNFVGSISSISQDSPISINLTGLKDAVDLVLTLIIPWRRQNAERLSLLEIRKREIEIEHAENELENHRYDIERKKLENKRIQYELANTRWELAERILNKIDPDSQLRGEKREYAFSHILEGIDQFSITNLEFEVVRENRFYN